MVITGSQLLTRSLIQIRVLGVGRTLTDRDAQRALPLLQELIDSMKAERRCIFTVARQPYTLVANQQTRTLGPTGNFVFTPRPIFLASASVIPVGDTLEQPVDIWTRAEYLAQRDKAITDLLPRALNMDPGTTNNTLTFWPIPTTAATLYLGIPTGIAAFADLTTPYTFIEGYHEALRLEMQKRLSGGFGKPWSEVDERALWKAWDRIDRMNDEGPPMLENDGALSPHGGGYYDVYSDSYRSR